MKRIRNLVFETNSSSTHSLIMDKHYYDIPDTLEPIEIDADRYTIYSTLGEKYTILLSMCERLSQLDLLMSKLKNIGIKHIILCRYDTTDNNYYGIGYSYNYEISDEECESFISTILESEDSLKTYLFDPSTRIESYEH